MTTHDLLHYVARFAGSISTYHLPHVSLRYTWGYKYFAAPQLNPFPTSGFDAASKARANY